MSLGMNTRLDQQQGERDGSTPKEFPTSSTGMNEKGNVFGCLANQRPGSAQGRRTRSGIIRDARREITRPYLIPLAREGGHHHSEAF